MSYGIKSEKFLAFPALQLFSLEGKAAIITGAGSGLGMEIAKGFAMSGADVALVDRNLEPVKRNWRMN